MAQKRYLVKSILLSFSMSSLAAADDAATQTTTKEVWYNAKGEAILVLDSKDGAIDVKENKVPTHLVRKGAETQNGNTIKWERGRKHRSRGYYYSPYIGSGVYYPYRAGAVYYTPAYRSNGFFGGYYNGKFYLNYRTKGFSIYGRF